MQNIKALTQEMRRGSPKVHLILGWLHAKNQGPFIKYKKDISHPTDHPTDGQTDTRAHREVTLPIKWIGGR